MSHVYNIDVTRVACVRNFDKDICTRVNNKNSNNNNSDSSYRFPIKQYWILSCKIFSVYTVTGKVMGDTQQDSGNNGLSMKWL